MKCDPASYRLESCPGCPGRNEWSKIRLELGWGRRDALPSFIISISCGHLIFDATKVSDKMQTKTAKKETRNVLRGSSRISKSLYNGEVSLNLCKGSHFQSEIKIRTFIHQGVNQPPHPDVHLLCHCFESVPGLPVNGDDHLDTLLVRTLCLPAAPRPGASPLV